MEWAPGWLIPCRNTFAWRKCTDGIRLSTPVVQHTSSTDQESRVSLNKRTLLRPGREKLWLSHCRAASTKVPKISPNI